MKYGGVNNYKQDTWESLLLNANNDFISVLILCYTGLMPRSTYAWMFSHTLEKYLKSYLKKTGNWSNKENKKISENGHGLKEIWEKYKNISNSTTSKSKLNNAFEELIEDISTIKTNIRYTGGLEYSSDNLIYFFIVLCSLLRYLIIGKTKYRSTFYGLDDLYFFHMNYHPMSLGYGNIIIHKMLHLALEHGCGFTNMGNVNSFGIKDYSISNTAIFEKLSDCPICNNSNINYLDVIKFYRDIKPTTIK